MQPTPPATILAYGILFTVTAFSALLFLELALDLWRAYWRRWHSPESHHHARPQEPQP